MNIKGKITSNKCNDRKHEIDTFTPHCYVGLVTGEQGARYLATCPRDVSANYVVGKDGDVWMNIPENKRAWTSSSEKNDTRAITVECACTADNYNTFPADTYDALVDLAVDVCKRYGFTDGLFYDKNLTVQQRYDKKKSTQMNLTLHREFSATGCPGPWFMEHIDKFVEDVNKRVVLKPAEDVYMYRVQVGAFHNESNAKRLLEQLKSAGFTNAYIRKDKE